MATKSLEMMTAGISGGAASRATLTAVDRARLSRGISNDSIYQAVARVIASRHGGGGTLVDVGCGTGNLWSFLDLQFDRYVGVDVARYDDLTEAADFYQIDLETGRTPLPSAVGDVVVAVETIEHLENPRAFVRELTRLLKPGGWLVVTTPNQLSLLSKLTLVLKNEFNAFHQVHYPAHLTALLGSDLLRIGAERLLVDLTTAYTFVGRIPGTERNWPRALSNTFPRAFSDNVLLVGRQPSSGQVEPTEGLVG